MIRLLMKDCLGKRHSMLGRVHCGGDQTADRPPIDSFIRVFANRASPDGRLIAIHFAVPFAEPHQLTE
jgi:hypothetical protein